MPDDAGGNYSLPDGYLAVTGQKVQPSNHNPPLEDIASALTNRYSRDGRAPLTGNMNANSFKIFGLADGVDPTDSVNKGQLDGVSDAKVNKAGDTMTGPLNLVDDDVWKIRVGIGEFYIVDTSITGVEIPPSTTTGVVFIQLTAGLTGSGQFNEGKLTSESVSGTAPLVVATAVVSLTGSPIDGKTVPLLNTEGRILRPSSSSGTKQNDQMQLITGWLASNTTSGAAVALGGAFKVASGPSSSPTISISGTATTNIIEFDSSASPGARAGNETRIKNLGVTAFMRIK